MKNTSWVRRARIGPIGMVLFFEAGLTRHRRTSQEVGSDGGRNTSAGVASFNMRSARVARPPRMASLLIRLAMDY